MEVETWSHPTRDRVSWRNIVDTIMNMCVFLIKGVKFRDYLSDNVFPKKKSAL
jgi:hypothetical protein